MRRLTLTFLFFGYLTSFLSAQRSFDGVRLTKEEIDSLRTGKASKYLQDKLELTFKAEQARRDSFIQTHILNQHIADFDARDTAGVLHRPSMYLGRVWLVHFWHFWDNSLYYEIPPLNAIVDSLRGEGVEVLSFLTYDLKEAEKKYLQKYPVKFPMIENAEKFGNQLFGSPFPRPYVVIVDKKGICRYFYDHTTLHSAKGGHRNELLEENKLKQPTYDFMEKVKSLLRE